MRESPMRAPERKAILTVRGAAARARELKIPEDSVLVASTGVIGMQLPMDRIGAGLRLCVRTGWES